GEQHKVSSALAFELVLSLMVQGFLDLYVIVGADDRALVNRFVTILVQSNFVIARFHLEFERCGLRQCSSVDSYLRAFGFGLDLNACLTIGRSSATEDLADSANSAASDHLDIVRSACHQH